ncbi:hypothetical protein [Kribbella sp. NPDC003557]|uniref:hypothetical protein n=1 Tax=Kribbella sp. NPDC003557 TaxID=3154449 RepID=UPI0033AE09BC
MADPVERLVQQVTRLVERDTVDGVASRRPIELSDGHVEMIQPLADNLDLPGRLATTLRVVSNHQDGRWYDRRADARAGLTELVALCADALEPDPSLPPPVDAGARQRLARAVTRAYAANATPRLVAGLFPDGRPDDLGRFAPPQLEGDVAAARAMAVAIGARTGLGEDGVLKRLVAAGHGGTAYEAAEMLLETRPDYERLPAEQRPGIRRHLARSIEAGFVVRDVREARARELTEQLENRREDVTGGAGTIDTASGMATDELGKLHAFLQKIDYWERSDPRPAGDVRAIVARELVSRVEHHAGIQADLTNAQLTSPSAVTAAAAETMVATSAIPAEHREAAAAATAGMLAEGFDELAALETTWRAGGADVNRQAALYGATLGDRTLAAVRTFEQQAPESPGADAGRGAEVGYDAFDTERRRITRAWGRDITDPEQLAAAVSDLREQATAIADPDARTKAERYLESLGELVTEARGAESEHVRRASDVLLRSTGPDGTADERRARAAAGMLEITRIAAEAPTAGERDAVLEMNEPLAVIVDLHDSGAGRGAEGPEARFAMDPAIAPAGTIAAPDAPAAARPNAQAESKAPVRDR